MAGWKCFIIAPSPFCQRSLRRFSFEKCASTSLSCHNAEVVIDERFEAPADLECGEEGGHLKSDPRWPAACTCGYAFKDNDPWQVNVTRLFQGAPDGRLYRLRDADLPIGAMWIADWLTDWPEGRAKFAGAAGQAWCLRLPGDTEWIVYGPSTSGPKWDVQGAPPGITVSPSINAQGRYHGYVKNGVVSPDCEGRTSKEPFTA